MSIIDIKHKFSEDAPLQELEALEATGKCSNFELLGQLPRNQINLRPRLWKEQTVTQNGVIECGERVGSCV